jgi:hypothetical protein
MENKISNWLDIILKIAGVIGVVTAIGTFVVQWYRGINTAQLILILISLFCVIVCLVALFFRWREKSKYENLPLLIEKRDNLILEYIDRSEINLGIEEWIALLKDLSQLGGFKIDSLLKVFPTKDENLIIREAENSFKNYANKMIPQKKTDETLIMLLDMGGILDSYNIGLQNITSKPKLKNLDKSIESLQRKVPAVKISHAVNDYYVWSEGLYITLLSSKSLYGLSLFKKSIPLKIKAKQSQIRPTIERQMTNLIAAVRESIVTTKEKKSSEITK